MRYLAAAIQFEPTLFAKERNSERLTALVREAAGAGARLIVLPEMATTGYRFHSAAEIGPLAEPVPNGPTTAHFERLSIELGIYLVVGLPEQDATTGKRYNTAVLLGPEGFVGKYRKLHLFDDDLTWAAEGDLGFPVFDTAIGQIGLVICMDLVFMEPCRVAALAGADVIAAPVNWSSAPVMWWARALENGIYLVCANRWGTERGARYAGKSAIVGPLGQVLAACGEGDEIGYAEVDTELARQHRAAALARRRPGRYRDLPATADRPERQVRVAVGQGRTAAAMQAQFLQAAAEHGGGLDLMLFPCSPGPDPQDLLTAAARQVGCHVVAGGELLAPDGRVAPAGPNLFDLPWGRLAVATGEDLRCPETVRSLVMGGADLIAAAADWPEGAPRWLWAVRWMENETPLAVANGGGGSRIWHADRPRPEAGAGSEAVITATVTVGRAREGFRYLRPAWYAGLYLEA